MLFCERITDAEALSVLKGGLDMNHPFWRDVRNKNPTTFDQLVEMIMEEIINENMILHRNRGGVAPNQVPRVNYGKTQVRHLPQPPRRRDYPADPNAGMSYVASAQEGMLPPHPVQMAPGSSTGAYNYGDSCPHLLRDRDRLAPHITTSPRNAKQDRGVGPAQGVGCSPRCTIAGPQGPDRRSLQWDRRPANQDPPRRNSRSPGRLPRVEGTTENRFIKGPEKPPIREIDTIHGGPYIGGQSRNAQKSYAKEVEGEVGDELAYKQSTLKFKQGRPNFLYRGRHERSSLPPLRRVGSQGSGGEEWVGKDASGQ
ncbi:Uncharacterized protein Adt_29020 [Abeliophyllum distichum]|uniref:Uncharacterized protein n=1 Tax=Abeliophyllum distichum TaxID=126358 RepID=A0ABD1RY71_9LAMI